MYVNKQTKKQIWRLERKKRGRCSFVGRGVVFTGMLMGKMIQDVRNVKRATHGLLCYCNICSTVLRGFELD